MNHLADEACTTSKVEAIRDVLWEMEALREWIEETITPQMTKLVG